MDTTTISKKYQIVIPQRVRRQLHREPGQVLQMIPYNHRIVLIPQEPMENARGFIKSMDTTIYREEDRSLYQ